MKSRGLGGLAALAAAALLVITDAGLASAQLVSGGGEAIIAGGFGFPPVPLKNIFAFRIDRTPEGGVTGTFDCLALAPTTKNGPGSGEFTENIMYVTGKITSVTLHGGGAASFSGTATVTGVGAGLDLPFDCDVTQGPGGPSEGGGGVGVMPGGPGATMTLAVSGLVFNEVLTSGAIRVSSPRAPVRIVR